MFEPIGLLIGSLDILFITNYKGETMQTETDLREAEIELAYQYLRQKDW
jgi:predicted transcriptional regulator